MATNETAYPGRLLLETVIGPDEIGQRIKRAREHRGWSQLKFAMEANVSPSSVSRWERGYLPPLRELIRIAELLEVEPETFVESGPTDEDELRALRSEVADVREALARVERLLSPPADETRAS